MRNPRIQGTFKSNQQFKKSNQQFKNTKSEIISSNDKFIALNIKNNHISSVIFDIQHSSLKLSMAGGNTAEVNASMGFISYKIGNDKWNMSQNSTNRNHESGSNEHRPIPVDILRDIFISVSKQLNQVIIKEKSENTKNISKLEILDIVKSTIDIKDSTKLFSKEIFITLQQYIKSESFSTNELDLVKKGLLSSSSHPGHEGLISRIKEICKLGGYDDQEIKQILDGKNLSHLDLNIVGSQILMTINNKSSKPISEVVFSYDTKKSPNHDDGNNNNDLDTDDSSINDLKLQSEGILSQATQFGALARNSYKNGINLVKKEGNKLVMYLNSGNIKTISCDAQLAIIPAGINITFNDGTKFRFESYATGYGRGGRMIIFKESGKAIRVYTLKNKEFLDDNEKNPMEVNSGSDWIKALDILKVLGLLNQKLKQ